MAEMDTEALTDALASLQDATFAEHGYKSDPTDVFEFIEVSDEMLLDVHRGMLEDAGPDEKVLRRLNRRAYNMAWLAATHVWHPKKWESLTLKMSQEDRLPSSFLPVVGPRGKELGDECDSYAKEWLRSRDYSVLDDYEGYVIGRAYDSKLCMVEVNPRSDTTSHGRSVPPRIFMDDRHISFARSKVEQYKCEKGVDGHVAYKVMQVTWSTPYCMKVRQMEVTDV
jgi:hypothetical protein